MIEIRHHELGDFAQRHYRSILNYLPKANIENRIDVINEKIQLTFGKEMDFEKLILALPSEMEELAEKWAAIRNDDFNFFKTLYTYFSSGNKFEIKIEEKSYPYGALRLVDDLQISVCPYCNRNFIFNTDEDGKRTCDIDHFFGKEEFSFLAISFFNLIPSCKFCNQSKGDKWNTGGDKMLINPYCHVDPNYEYGFEEKLTAKVVDCTFYYNPNGLKVGFDEKKITRAIWQPCQSFLPE